MPVLQGEVLQVLADFVTDTAKETEPLRFGSVECSRILEVVMDDDGATWKNRTTFPGVVADCKHVVEPLPRKLIDMLAPMSRNVDPKFPHDRDSFGANLARSRAGALHFEAIAGVVTQQSLGHLATSGVAGTQNEDSFLSGHRGAQASERAPWLRQLRRFARR